MTFIDAPFSVGRNVGNQGHRAGTLDRMRELPLMPGTTSRDTPRNDFPALGDEVAKAADVLVVDEVNLVRAEFADLPPTEPAALDRLLRRGNGLLLLERLAGDVVVGRCRHLVAGERRRRRHGGCRRTLAATHELDALGNDLGHGPLLAVLAFPVPGLQATFDEDLTALVEVFAARFGLLAPHDDGEKRRFLAFLATLCGVVPVHREAQISDSGAARGVTKLRGAGQITDQKNFVEARHQPTSSSTSGCGLLGRAFLRMGTRVERKRSTFSLRRSWRSNSLIIDGSADTSRTAYVPSRCLRMSYASRRLPQFSTLVTSAPSPLSCSPTCVSNAATSSSVGRGSTMTRIS